MMKSLFFSLILFFCVLLGNFDNVLIAQNQTNSPLLPPNSPTSASSAEPIFPPLDNSYKQSIPMAVESKEKTPAVPYPSIMEEDIVYRQRVWEELDSRQKINLPFSPMRQAEDPNTLRFIDVLYEGLRRRELKGYNASDDRFTTPLTDEEVREIIIGKPDTVEVVDASDPRGLRRIKKVQFAKPEIENIFKVRIVEEWVFERNGSRFHCRILGIAPVLSLYDDNDNYLGDRPLFWIYYPESRDYLNNYSVINWKNYQQRVSWQQLLELRYFSGNIIQTTMDNPLGLRLSEYISDSRERLIESERIRNEIFDYEQSLWEY